MVNESDIDTEPTQDRNPEQGYMSREEYVWHEDRGDVVAFFIDKQNPDTGEIYTEHVCTLQKTGEVNRNGDEILGDIDRDEWSLRNHRPVEPGYCRKDSIPYRVDQNYKPDNYTPDTTKCHSCGREVQTGASRSPKSAVSNNRCPHCNKSLKSTRR